MESAYEVAETHDVTPEKDSRRVSWTHGVVSLFCFICCTSVSIVIHFVSRAFRSALTNGA